MDKDTIKNISRLPKKNVAFKYFYAFALSKITLFSLEFCYIAVNIKMLHIINLNKKNPF